ncbi:hypothetical protein AALO_G00110160 [Alosa alosa]|uniref:Uncharacterized protein n=1 Tax=Alosa alosa TaxID=278164 RepID=A0AAV6GT70_9TELE|nr:uncharacterized protein LOC125299178 [Alosa alosa]XP_048106292.1 uncharacterized protein LOC125299178 [Alosa alosa]KAG5276822.1 hypothetical protein AALO_G00110160 [Alosa alosa]
MSTMDLHPHCSTCVNLHCPEPAHPGASCQLTSCPLACGAAFHSCKASEHRLLCPLEPVACPSRAYGCPLTMPRARVAQHLSVCPASVVRCRNTHFPNMQHTAGAHTLVLAASTPDEHSADTYTASVHCTDANTSNTNVPLTHSNFIQASSTQTQNVNLCKITSGINFKDIPEDPIHKRNKSLPNGEYVLCNSVTNVSKDLDQSVTEAASTRKPITTAAAKTDNHLDQSDRAETNKGGSEGQCGGTSADATPGTHRSACESSASGEEECPMSGPLSDLDAFPPCYDREARLLLLQRFLPPELSARLADTPANHGGEPAQEENQPMEECSTTADHAGLVKPGTITTTTENMEGSPGEAHWTQEPLNATPTTTTAEMPSQTAPILGTQTGTLVSPGPCQHPGEPPGMCGHLFRRDEFLWHSRNVHADLDLLERACPLSTYGCPVTQRQLCASTGGGRTRAHLVYDARLGAYGLRPISPPGPAAVTPDPLGHDRLSTLPLELLRHLLGYLDGFSLNQLALASGRMREVCASLLRARGIVLLRWAQCPHNDTDHAGARRWRVQEKVWRFSMAFSCVESWDLVEAPSLSNHLQCCLWNQVERPLEARALPCMSSTAELERQKPIRAYPPAGRNASALFHSLTAVESPDSGCR